MARLRTTALAASMLVLMAQGGCPLSGILITAPANGTLTDDPNVSVDVSFGRDLGANVNGIAIDGVDLIAALGLTPPFSGASGVVQIGGAPVAISAFSYAIPAQDPVRITLQLAGLASGLHQLDAEGFDILSTPVTKAATFEVLADPLTLELEVISSAGGPATPVISATRVGKSSLGESLAGPPVTLSGGAGTLRQGFVPAAQGAP